MLPIRPINEELYRLHQPIVTAEIDDDFMDVSAWSRESEGLTCFFLGYFSSNNCISSLSYDSGGPPRIQCDKHAQSQARSYPPWKPEALQWLVQSVFLYPALVSAPQACPYSFQWIQWVRWIHDIISSDRHYYD